MGTRFKQKSFMKRKTSLGVWGVTTDSTMSVRAGLSSAGMACSGLRTCVSMTVGCKSQPLPFVEQTARYTILLL